jgi:ferredoxin
MSEKVHRTIVVEDLDAGFRDEMARVPGGENITKCFACGTCAAGCPVTAVDEEYNCRKIIRPRRAGTGPARRGPPVAADLAVRVVLSLHGAVPAGSELHRRDAAAT